MHIGNIELVIHVSKHICVEYPSIYGKRQVRHKEMKVFEGIHEYWSNGLLAI